MRLACLALLLLACDDAPSVGVGVDGWTGFDPSTDASVAPDVGAPPAAPPLGATPHAGGTIFRVWAPNADSVSVMGDFDGWDRTAHPMTREPAGGIFAADVAGAHPGQGYQYVVRRGAEELVRQDPRARATTGFNGASVIVDPAAYVWQTPAFTPPPRELQVVYEMHPGTFHVPAGATWGTLDDAAEKLDHLAALGVNMIELMPPVEYRGDKSWGYNPQFPFAVEKAYGGPEALRRFADAAHARGLGVLIDIVHNHWTGADQPFKCFDGDCKGRNRIYFYSDAARAATPWGPRPDFGRAEIRDYVRDNAIMYLDEYRCDGFRWDSTLNIHAYNDGATPIPEGWAMLRAINEVLHQRFPKAIQIAEDFRENLAISRPPAQGGAGFDAQWDPGFLHPVNDNILAATDGARSMTAIRDALAKRYNGSAMQRVVYTESHDEVANGKRRIPETISPGAPESLVARKRSTLGAAIVLTAPGIPMLFMGMEFLTGGSFADQKPLDWTRVQSQSGVLAMYQDLVALRTNKAGTTRGLAGNTINVFHVNDAAKVIAYHRSDKGGAGDDVVVIASFANRSFTQYDVGLPRPGTWRVRFNSDSSKYGADFANTATKDAATIAEARDGFAQKAGFALGPYAVVILSQ